MRVAEHATLPRDPALIEAVTQTQTLAPTDTKEKLKARIKIPFLLFLIGCVLAIFCSMDLPGVIAGIQSESWPQAPGISLRSGLAHQVLGKDPAWRPVVVYHYQVNGKDYYNDTIAFQEWLGLAGFEAGVIRSRYVPGSSLTVYYDPNKPELSCLEKGVRWWDPVMHLICYVLIAALLFLSCYPPVKPEPDTSL